MKLPLHLLVRLGIHIYIMWQFVVRMISDSELYDITYSRPDEGSRY